MKNEEIQSSISTFYKYNHIDYKQYTDDMEEHYKTGRLIDEKIHKPNLERVLKEWLQNFKEEDREYYLRLFEHFSYDTRQSFEYKVYYLKKYVFEILSQYSPDEIMIVFSESKNGFKSGASEMSTAWWRACSGEMRKSQLIEVCSKVKIEDLIKMKAIVFMDDIVATGFTLKATIMDFFERFPYNEFEDTSFYATGVVATKRGKRVMDNLKKQGLDVTWIYNQEYLLQAFKGDYIFKGDEVRDVENAVLEYEKQVGYDKSGKSFVMGFEQCKLLVGFHYEIPNNTICTFWRYGERHVPLFERSGNQTISLAEIRQRKKRMRDNAYIMKSIEET